MSLIESNNFHILRSSMAPEFIFPEEELAVTTPRHPWTRKVDPPRPRRPKPSHASSHMGWVGDKPTKARVRKGPAREESWYNPEF